MEITDAEFEAANRRGLAKKSAFPAAVTVRYDRRIARTSALKITDPPVLTES